MVSSDRVNSDGVNADTDPLTIERQVCFALAVANRSVLGVYRPLLEPLNLTHPQYLVMLAAWESSPRSVKDIAETLQLDSASLSPLLKRLESLGYLTRTRAPHDERVLLIEPTATGWELRQSALRIPEQVVERLGVPLAELEELRAMLQRINQQALSARARSSSVGV
ncbi:MarR family transcriptional regulator [Gordonia jinhuaensis]|uniref:MarR family transcriptional regulator n=1 Tax=Gordonia jinhuaensis TaxID=1517702 RepID=A0A916T7N4_9ACTN|nr:MarR family transcriptional regulator [Gordonia jinhuaensis]